MPAAKAKKQALKPLSKREFLKLCNEAFKKAKADGLSAEQAFRKKASDMREDRFKQAGKKKKVGSQKEVMAGLAEQTRAGKKKEDLQREKKEKQEKRRQAKKEKKEEAKQPEPEKAKEPAEEKPAKVFEPEHDPQEQKEAE